MEPVKAPPLGAPAERISRRSREHRPTIGVLESPQVTPMCLLGSSRWHSAVQAYSSEFPIWTTSKGSARAHVGIAV
jgi:hypothetical protein